MILHAGFCIVFCFLVPAENVTRIYFVFHIIQTRIIAVGNDGMCLWMIHDISIFHMDVNLTYLFCNMIPVICRHIIIYMSIR